jgi:N-methylhydantoinase A
MTPSHARPPSPDARHGGHRIGIDVGGTFTDFSVLRLADGEVLNFKEPSTPADPSIAVSDGLAALMVRHGLSPSDIGLIVHGTTIGLNAILQRKGAALALVVSDGNRDILEIGRGRMTQPYAMFGDKEPALVPREDVHTCSARIGADGAPIAFPAAAELDALAGRLRERGVHAVAITLLNAYANPAAEQRLEVELSARLPQVMLTTSSEIWPEMREYERCLIAALNASIQPLMTQYYTRLQARLETLGVTCPLFVTTSNGGTLSLQSAVQRPIDTVLSGPASGVVAAANLAALLDIERVVTVDMGGTSSDMAVCSATRPELTTHTQLGDFPLAMPTVNVTAIGAGGGSIVRVDDHGLLKVGPESAGADPGPVCYARGGTQPTLTDCYLAIGLLRPDGFADGRLTLDRHAALQSLDAIGAALKLPAPHRALRAATAALSVATAKMATEMLKELARRGVDPNEVVLLPFGGAGPTHAAMLAEEVRVHRIAVPSAPGLFCARGALAADARRDFIRTVKRELDDGTAALAAQHIDTMRDEATRWLDAEGELIATRAFVQSMDMRYVGQAYEINVEIGDETFTRASLAARFHEAHRRQHGFADASAPVEVHSVRVQAVGGMQRPPAARWRRADGTAAAVRRPIWQGDDWIDFSVVQRHGLAAGDALRGPMVVEQADTTLAIPFGWIATVKPDGSLWMEKTS